MTVETEVDRNGNPYGGVPSGGITLPPYYRPTPDLVSNNLYYPGQEELGPDEMRISFIGSTPIPVTRAQAGTCIMVELGNGKRLFFDFGSGCMRNIIAMAVPLSTVNDIFFTHLHVDHYADLPYLFAFAPWVGRWKPLRVHGPSGRTPKDGIAHMIEGMKMMTHWHTDSFNCCPIGDGYEVEVNEFDFRDDNGVCYDQDGVTVRHWRRSHTKDGASAYRLDWNGLSFVWTGRRPTRRAHPRAGRRRGRLRDRGAAGHGEPAGVEVRDAAGDAHEHDRPGAQRSLRGRLRVRQDPAASRDGHAHELRRGAGPRDRRRDPPPLRRALPVRRPRRRGRQRQPGCGLDTQGADPRRRQHGAPEPPRGLRAVRPEPDGSRGHLPDSAADDRRHAGTGGSATGRSTRGRTTRPICIASRSPTSPPASRSTSVELAAKRVRHMQEKLAAKQDQLSQVMAMLEQDQS